MPDTFLPDGSRSEFSEWKTSIYTCYCIVQHTVPAFVIRSSWHIPRGTCSTYPCRSFLFADSGKEFVSTKDERLLSGCPGFQQQKQSVPVLLLLFRSVYCLRRNAILHRAPDWFVRHSRRSPHAWVSPLRYILLPNSDTLERKERLRSPHLRHVPDAAASPSMRHPQWKQTAPSR